MKVLYWIFIGWWFWPFQLLWKYREPILATQFWKKKVFWIVVAVLCLFSLIGSCGNSSPSEDATVPNTEVIETTIPIEEIIIPTETAAVETPIATNPVETTETTEPEVPETTLPAETEPPETEPVVVYVYITPTGEKYHTARCRYHDEGDQQITEEQAIAAGYVACKVCH